MLTVVAWVILALCVLILGGVALTCSYLGALDERLEKLELKKPPTTGPSGHAFHGHKHHEPEAPKHSDPERHPDPRLEAR